MARTAGALNQSTIEFRNEIDALEATGKYPNFRVVLLALLKSRKASIRLQAAKIIADKYYPSSGVSAKLDVGEDGGQLVLAWGQVDDEQPPPIDVTAISEELAHDNA